MASNGTPTVSYRDCWRLLRKDQELFFLPAIGLAVYLCAAGLAFSAAAGLGVAWSGLSDGVLVFSLLELFFIGFATSTIFLQGVVAASIQERTKGRNPGLAISWRIAWAHRRALFAWAVALTVFASLAVLFARAGGILGRLVSAFSTVAWDIGTVFLVPTLIANGCGLRPALKQSERTFRQGLESGLKSLSGFGLTTAAITLAILFVGPPVFVGLPLMVALATGASDSLALRAVVGGLVLWSATLLFWIGLSAVLHGIQISVLFNHIAAPVESKPTLMLPRT